MSPERDGPEELTKTALENHTCERVLSEYSRSNLGGDECLKQTEFQGNPEPLNKELAT